MPISTRGRSSSPDRIGAQRGFTLLEVMVVVVIIAILTALGVLSIGALGGDRSRDAEVERFEDVVATAMQEAELEGRDFGVRIQQSSYEVYVYSPRRQRWETVRDDRLYAVHSLPAGLEFGLTLEGRPVQLDAEPPAASEQLDAAAELATGTDRRREAAHPQLIFYAGGEVAPYQLEFRREGDTRPYIIEQAADGAITTRSPDQAGQP